MSKHCIQVMLPESKEGKLKDLEPIQKSLNEINFRSLLFALIAAISLIIVGNFRSTESMNIHTTLAVLTFTMIYVYSLHICYILYQLSAYSNVCQSKPISLAIFILIGSLGAINSGIGVLINLFQVGEKLFDPEFRLKWNDSQEGYFWHVFSTANEWVAIIFMSLIFLCASKRIYLYNKHWNRII
ncbi:hypothetical protein BLOT_008837 [Blomia tropicalis]|nr:hypothetical protein BLOT_008837 [Blomia tropicalis]